MQTVCGHTNTVMRNTQGARNPLTDWILILNNTGCQPCQVTLKFENKLNLILN